MSSIRGISIPRIVLELRDDVHTLLLLHGIGNEPVHTIKGFGLCGLVGANNPGEIDLVIVVELRGSTKGLSDARFAVAIIVIGVARILRIARSSAARIGHVILIAHGIVMEPGGSGL